MTSTNSGVEHEEFGDAVVALDAARSAIITTMTGRRSLNQAAIRSLEEARRALVRDKHNLTLDDASRFERGLERAREALALAMNGDRGALRRALRAVDEARSCLREEAFGRRLERLFSGGPLDSHAIAFVLGIAFATILGVLLRF